MNLVIVVLHPPTSCTGGSGDAVSDHEADAERDDVRAGSPPDVHYESRDSAGRWPQTASRQNRRCRESRAAPTNRRDLSKVAARDRCAGVTTAGNASRQRMREHSALALAIRRVGAESHRHRTSTTWGPSNAVSHTDVHPRRHRCDRGCGRPATLSRNTGGVEW